MPRTWSPDRFGYPGPDPYGPTAFKPGYDDSVFDQSRNAESVTDNYLRKSSLSPRNRMSVRSSKLSESGINRFDGKKITRPEPFVGPDGTLIFQHPTIPNYYENSDKPELKGNPYSNIMYYPHYDPYMTGRVVPVHPGVAPNEPAKTNSIKREKRMK